MFYELDRIAAAEDRPEKWWTDYLENGLNLVEAVAAFIATFALCPYAIAAGVKA